MPEANEMHTIALTDFVASGKHKEGIFGQQWGIPEEKPHLLPIIEQWMRPNFSKYRIAMEIGSGGGRWSRLFRNEVQQAILVDATPACEAAIRERFDWDGWWFVVSKTGRMPTVSSETVDYCFSFDTFVHFNVDLFDAYIVEIGRVLRLGGILHLHYAQFFPGSSDYNAECFKYRHPDCVISILRKSGLLLTGKQLDYKGGFGSRLIEAVRIKL